MPETLTTFQNTREVILRLGVAFVVLSTSFYTAKVFISPIYAICGIGIIICLTCIIMLGLIRYRLSTLIAAFLLLYTIAVSGNFLNGALFNLVFGLSAYIILTSLPDKFPASLIVKLANQSVWAAIILITFDTAWRLTHPLIPDVEMLSAFEERNTIFYLYKYNSLMFADSNTTALIVIQYFFLSMYLKRHHKIDIFYRAQQMIIIALLALSFSRAAILSASIVYLMIVIGERRSKTARIIAITALVLVGGIGFNFLLGDDLSFQIKFDIFAEVENYFVFGQSLFTKIIGIGLDQSSDVIGIAAHNIFLTYALELGLLGLIIFLTFLFAVYTDAKVALRYGIAPAIISGLSYYFYAGAPFFFVPLGIIVFLESRNRTRKIENCAPRVLL